MATHPKDKKPSTEIYVLMSRYNEKFLYLGKYFEEALLLELLHFKETMKPEEYQETYSELLKLLESKDETKFGEHPEDRIHIAFDELVTIDKQTAKKLSLFDIISPDTFTSESKLGNQIIRLMEDADLRFIVWSRYWWTRDTLRIGLAIAHEDYIIELHEIMVNGLYIAE